MATIQIAATADVFLRSDTPTSNYGGGANLFVGERNDLSGVIYRSLLFFDIIGNIPAGSIINSVTLYISHTTNQYATNTRLMHVYRVVRNWIEAQATWNVAKTGTNWGTAGCANTTSDYVNTSLGSRSFTSSEANGWKSITLTASVFQQILDGSLTYEGLILRMATETDDMQGFASRETTPAAYLEIDYTPPGAEFQVVFID